MYHNQKLQEIDIKIATVQEEITFGKSLRDSFGPQTHIILHLEQLYSELADLNAERLKILGDSPN